VVTVNGLTCSASVGNDGDGQMEDVKEGRWIYFGVRFRPGAPGKKHITIKLGDVLAKASFDYEPTAGFFWQDVDQDEGFFGVEEDPKRGVHDLHWKGVYVKGGSVRAVLNGAIQEPLTQTSSTDSQILDGVLKETSMREGHNLAAVSATDLYGNTLSAEIKFYLFRTNRVPLGTVFNLRLGQNGSKRGPFYNVEIQGSNLVEDKIGRTVMRNNTFTRLQAAHPGKTRITVFEGWWHKSAKKRVASVLVEVTDQTDQP
jgi:hypothetical protein